MKSVLLIGLGRFGKHVAMKLSELGHEIMAIDMDEKRVDSILPFVTDAQIGDSTDEEFLSSLGVDNYDVCIVAIGNNFQNSVETTALLKDLDAKFVVARASRDRHARFLQRNGADEIVYPEKQLGNWTAIRYSSNHIFDYIEIDEEHAIFEVAVPSVWVGKTIGHLDIRKSHGIIILGIKVNGHLNLSVTADTELKENDTMLVIGTTKNIHKEFHL